MKLKNVIETVYGDYPEYDTFTFDGVTYGRLPKLDEPEKIGIGTYPIFDEGYRPIINGKIIDEYFNREIGTETIDDFKLMIRRKLDQIMPYYNQLYKSTQVEYDALATMDIRSNTSAEMLGEENLSANTTATTETDGKARVVNSSTPQTMLKGNGDYASAGTDTNSESDASSNSDSTTASTSKTNNTSENRVTGYQGIASDLIMKYRSSLINIDTMILSDIEDCFMLILTNGDSFTFNERHYF